MFSIITTNKNRTAIAPTYTIKKISAKKSKFSNRSNPAELQKTRIKKSTEYTGFFARMTIKAENRTKKQNK
tara:strand:- start:493 stop:705 length:213 start_codon:yes stop_codon:yes gene_type:complete